MVVNDIVYLQNKFRSYQSSVLKMSVFAILNFEERYEWPF